MLAKFLSHALSLSAALALVGCGSQLDNNGVDESEANGLQIEATLAVPSNATVCNEGGSGLNLRSGAGTGYSVLVTMPTGSGVRVVGNAQNSFYKVTYGSSTGWAHMNYLCAAGTSGGGVYPGNIHWVPASSQNYTKTRQGVKIIRVIIHDMEGTYAGSISWFQNPAAQASAHYCLRSSDGDITQMVSEGDIAWHAGNWPYNQSAIGIEHEGWMSQPSRWYTDVMYRRSAQLTAAISKRYGIPVDRSHIIGHYQVPPPSNHTDPGPGWDWNKYMSLVHSFR